MKRTNAGALLNTRPKTNAERHSARSMQERTSDPAMFVIGFRPDSQCLRLLAHRHGFPHSDLGHGSAHDRGDLADLEHQLIELIGE